MRQRPLLVLCGALTIAGTSLPAIAAQKSAFISFGDSADAPAGYTEMCERDPVLCQPPSGQTQSPSAPAAGEVPAPAAAISAQAAERPDDVCTAGAESAAHQCSAGVMPAYFFTASLAATDLTKRKKKITALERKTRRSLARTVRTINLTVNRSVRQRSDLQIYGADEYWKPSGMGPSAVGDCEDIALQKKLLLIEAGFPAERLFLAVVFRSGVGLHTVLVARLDDGDVVLDSAAQPVWNWQKTPYSWLRVQSPQDPMKWHRIGAA